MRDKRIALDDKNNIVCRIEVCKYNVMHECCYKDNILVRGDCEHKPYIIKIECKKGLYPSDLCRYCEYKECNAHPNKPTLKFKSVTIDMNDTDIDKLKIICAKYIACDYFCESCKDEVYKL